MTEELFCTIIFEDKSIYKSLKKNFSKIPLINNIIKNSENHLLQIEWTDLCSKINDIHEREKLQNSNKNIIKFIFDYSSLYHDDKMEIFPPKIKYVKYVIGVEKNLLMVPVVLFVSLFLGID